MKISYGETYEEAILKRPMIGVRKEEFWSGSGSNYYSARKNNSVVFDFKQVREVSVHEWVRYKRFEVKILDKRTMQLVVDRTTGKQIQFNSISKAMKWIWEEDKEIYYEKLENLSTKSSKDDGPVEETRRKCVDEEDLPF